MRTVRREEILDFVTYEDRRAELRRSAMRAKDARRIHVGRHLTFLFENHETIRYQVQEMTRAERMVKESDIQHEIDTYNELLGQDGDLGCTLLIEIDDPVDRADKLARWLSLPGSLYAELPDGRRVRPTCDERQIGATRLSSVQYLKFAVQGQTPAAIGCDLDDPEVCGHTRLTPEQRASLAEDLAG